MVSKLSIEKNFDKMIIVKKNFRRTLDKKNRLTFETYFSINNYFKKRKNV